eukprot:gene5642-7023_t
MSTSEELQNAFENPEMYKRYNDRVRNDESSHKFEKLELRKLLPSTLKGKSVIDLGCGIGETIEYLKNSGLDPKTVVGVDLSKLMIDAAKLYFKDDFPSVSFQNIPMQDIDFDPNSIDLIVSSFAFHFVKDFDTFVAKLHKILTPGGNLIFSVLHPVFTCAKFQWYSDSDGNRLHWPLDNYFHEGQMTAHYLVQDIVYYHRSIETYVRILLKHGFKLDHLGEPHPNPITLPQKKDFNRVPHVLLFKCTK